MTTNDPDVLSPFEAGYLAGYSRRTGGGLDNDQAQRLIRSHERLRAKFTEACVRLAKQSDLLSKKAERPEEPPPHALDR